MIPVGELFGYLSLAWIVLNFFWAILRGHGLYAAAYGIGLFAAIVIALNVGGILNETTWHYFGIVIFALEFVFHFFKGHRAKMVIFGILLFSTLVLGW